MSIQRRGVRVRTRSPKDRPLRTRIAWKLKYGKNGFEKVKCRICADGSTEKDTIDFYSTDISVSILRRATLKMLIGLAANDSSLGIAVYDLSQAFTTAKTHATYTMRIPASMGIYKLKAPVLEGATTAETAPLTEDQRQLRRTLVMECQTNLYGRHDAMATYLQALHKNLVKFGYNALAVGSPLYIRMRDGSAQILLIYVDDITIIAKSTELENIRKELDSVYQRSSWHKLTEPGQNLIILGMTLTRHATQSGKTYYSISQEEKFDTLIALAEKQLGHIPMKDTRLPKEDITKRPAKSITTEERMQTCKVLKTDNFQQAVTFMQQCVGSLLYLSQTCNPELGYPSIVLGRRTISPTENVAQALIHALGYAKSIKSQATILGHPDAWARRHRLVALSDSSLGNGPQGYSTAGFSIHAYGTPILNKVITLKCVCLSSCEAELLAMSKATQATIRYHNILQDLQPAINTWNIETDQTTPVLGKSTLTKKLFGNRYDGRQIFIAGDNQSALRLAPRAHESVRISHIRTQTLFISEQVYKNKLCGLMHVDTNDIAVDIDTKVSTGATTNRHGKFLRGVPMETTPGSGDDTQ